MKKIFILLFAPLISYTQTQKIKFTSPLLYPEGTSWCKNGNVFYVSSATTGTIGKVTFEGKYEPVYIDSSLKSSFGMKVDEKNQLLWVCAGDPNYSRFSDSSTYQKMARVIAIDLQTKKIKTGIDLSNLYEGRHFANDLAMDDRGNIFVTDSYSPVIYKIDAGGKASVFAENELFRGIDIGLNGIVYHKNGFLLAVNNANGCVLKVDINDPHKAEIVKTKNLFPGADGIVLDADGNLILAQNKGVNKIFRLTSTDNWNSAEVTGVTAAADNFQNPSTLTIADNRIYALNAKLNELTDSSRAPSTDFSLQFVYLRSTK